MAALLPMKIKSIRIQRFKRLESVDFDVEGVNILVGGNNSGKSTIIQAVHFAFTLFPSLTIANKWPAKEKKSTTISPTELIYIPSEDPYSLGFGGRLFEDEDKAIILQFTFSNGEKIGLSIRKGRINNILVEPDNIEFARNISSLDAPYSIFSPGLAGVSRTEHFVSDGVLLRALARGDANVVLRNILYRLHQKDEWESFTSDLTQIFPDAKLEVHFAPRIDQFITVNVLDGVQKIPLDLAGTGLLQSIQILAYFHLFSPKIIILDEPDSHLHPNNQRLLCSLLSSLSLERDVQVLITTHSRHVLDTMYNDAKLLWVRDGAVSSASAEDQLDILLELGALDIREKLTAGKYEVVFLTEDRLTSYISILLRNSGFDLSRIGILPYNGVTSTHLLKPLVKQIKDVSSARIIVHRDRDYMTQAEADEWSKEIVKIGGEPYVTSEIDVEGYFSTPEYMKTALPKGFDIEELFKELLRGEEDELISSFVNGRIDFERKRGTIGSLNHGALSVQAKDAVKNPLSIMKGKRRLAKLRRILKDEYGLALIIDSTQNEPRDKNLEVLAKKLLPKQAPIKSDTEATPDPKPAGTLKKAKLKK